MSATEILLLIVAVAALVVAFFALWDAAEQREIVVGLDARLDTEQRRGDGLQRQVDELTGHTPFAPVIPMQRGER